MDFILVPQILDPSARINPITGGLYCLMMASCGTSYLFNKQYGSFWAQFVGVIEWIIIFIKAIM